MSSMSEEKKNEALYDAVRSGDVGDVRRLLDDQIVDDGWKRTSLLHVAAERGHVSVMELLLEKGGGINAGDVCGDTPLHRAARRGNTEVIACIAERGGDVNAKNNNGNTPLHIAAYNGEKAAVQFVLDQKCKVDTRNSRGSTPLHIAAKKGYTEVIACIAESGGDVNSTDNNGNTPLHIAEYYWRKAAVQFLLDQKCKVDTRNSRGSTPLHIAAEEGYTEVIACIVERGGDVNSTDKDGNTPLHIAAIHGRKAAGQFLLDQKCNVDTRNSRGSTPLHDAARWGWTEVIACIAERGGDVNATNEDGDTPLHLAVLNRRTDAVTFLQRYGAEVTLHPSITLRDAILSDCVQLFNLLVEAGADVNAKACRLKETLLHQAVRHGYLNIVEGLIGRCCDVNAADQKGNTPLHVAAQHGWHGLIKTLVDAGGNVNSAGGHDRTPLHVAVCKKKRTCVSALLGLNADTECVDGDGKTARDLSPTKAITKLLSDQSTGGCNVAIPTNEQPHVNRKRHHDKAPEAAQIQTSPDLSNTYLKRPYITSITPVGVNTSTVTSPSQSMMSLLNNTSDEHGPSSSDYIFSPSDLNTSSVTSPSTPQMSGEHGSSVVRDEIHPTTSYEQAESSHLVYTVQSSAKSQQSMHGNATYITTTASSIQKPEDTSDASNLGSVAHSFETPKLTTLTPEKGHVSSSIDLQDDDNYNDWDSLERPNVTGPLHVNFENRTQEQSTYINDVGLIPNHILTASSSPERPPPQSAVDIHAQGTTASMDISQLSMELTQLQAQCRHQADEIRRLQDEVVSLKAATKPPSNQCQSEVGQPPDTNQSLQPASGPLPAVIDKPSYYVKLAEENERLKEHIRLLKESSQSKPPSETSVVPPLYERLSNPNHYQPTHGQRISQCLYKILPAGQRAPQGYEQLAEGSAHNVVVPSDWMEDFRKVCMSKPPSYQLTKMVDGLYEPKELYKKKASSDLYSTDLGKALRSYAIDVLKMASSQVTNVLNSKITTVTRRCRQQQELLQ